MNYFIVSIDTLKDSELEIIQSLPADTALYLLMDKTQSMPCSFFPYLHNTNAKINFSMPPKSDIDFAFWLGQLSQDKNSVFIITKNKNFALLERDFVYVRSDFNEALPAIEQAIKESKERKKKTASLLDSWNKTQKDTSPFYMKNSTKDTKETPPAKERKSEKEKTATDLSINIGSDSSEKDKDIPADVPTDSAKDITSDITAEIPNGINAEQENADEYAEYTNSEDASDTNETGAAMFEEPIPTLDFGFDNASTESIPDIGDIPDIDNIPEPDLDLDEPDFGNIGNIPDISDIVESRKEADETEYSECPKEFLSELLKYDTSERILKNNSDRIYYSFKASDDGMMMEWLMQMDSRLGKELSRKISKLLKDNFESLQALSRKC